MERVQKEKLREAALDRMAKKQRLLREAKEDVKVREELVRMNKAKTAAWSKGEEEDEKTVAATSNHKAIASSMQMKDELAHKKENVQREQDVAAITGGLSDGVDQQKLEQQIDKEHKVEAAKEKVLGKMHEETQNRKDVDAITGGLLDTEKRNQQLIHSHIAEEHKVAAQRTEIAQAATAQKMKDEISSITSSASPKARTHFDLSVHKVVLSVHNVVDASQHDVKAVPAASDQSKKPLQQQQAKKKSQKS